MSVPSEGLPKTNRPARTVRLAAPPTWVGGSEQILMWVEIGDGAGTQVWEPSTPAEIAAARQFFELAQGIDWSDGAIHEVTIPGYASGG